MAEQTFRAELTTSGTDRGGHLVAVPDDVVAALGGKGRTPVQATFNGVPYRGSIVRMGGGFCIGVTKAIIADAGVEPGDLLDVMVRLDDAPREVDVPPELAAAFEARPELRAAWDRWSYTRRKQAAAGVTDAKRRETRDRRIEQILTELA
jgi:Domain of unknown function (DUF1905)/Bacteriocin-protection, YdeI or OmpD-Associated